MTDVTNEMDATDEVIEHDMMQQESQDVVINDMTESMPEDAICIVSMDGHRYMIDASEYDWHVFASPESMKTMGENLTTTRQMLKDSINCNSEEKDMEIIASLTDFLSTNFRFEPDYSKEFPNLDIHHCVALLCTDVIEVLTTMQYEAFIRNNQEENEDEDS